MKHNWWLTRLMRPWLKRRTVWWPVESEDIKKVTSLRELIDTIHSARNARKILRVCGSQHSSNRAIFDPLTRSSVLRIKLEGDFRRVEHLGDGVYRVGGGCNFGVDDFDPTSTDQNSFDRIADRDGYALPLLGGISAQTIGGFLSTGSSGGSLRHGLADFLESFEIVDGKGQVHNLTKGTDAFNAAGVSMGLFGVIVSATFRLQKRYLVVGTEQTVPYAQSMLKDGPAFIQANEANEYVHLLWVPNRGVENVLQYVGNQGAPDQSIVSYFHPLHSEFLSIVASFFITIVDLAIAKGWSRIVKFLILLLNPNDKVPRHFRDHWWRALPNDDLTAIASWIRVQLTEVWIDLADSDAAIAELRELFAKDPVACGSFGIEMYAAKRSPFWMSMAHECDVIRIDPYWLEYNSVGTLPDFFGRIWMPLLSKFPSARLHWGKHFPAVGTSFGGRTIGPDYCRKTYPYFDKWLAMREEFDPDELFLTDYWRSILIAPSNAEVSSVENR